MGQRNTTNDKRPGTDSNNKTADAENPPLTVNPSFVVCDPTLALQRQSGGLARDHQFFIGWNDKAGQTSPFSDAAIAVLPGSFIPSLVDLGMQNREILERF